MRVFPACSHQTIELQSRWCVLDLPPSAPSWALGRLDRARLHPPTHFAGHIAVPVQPSPAQHPAGRFPGWGSVPQDPCRRSPALQHTRRRRARLVRARGAHVRHRVGTGLGREPGWGSTGDMAVGKHPKACSARPLLLSFVCLFLPLHRRHTLSPPGGTFLRATRIKRLISESIAA